MKTQKFVNSIISGANVAKKHANIQYEKLKVYSQTGVVCLVAAYSCLISAICFFVSSLANHLSTFDVFAAFFCAFCGLLMAHVGEKYQTSQKDIKILRNVRDDVEEIASLAMILYQQMSDKKYDANAFEKFMEEKKEIAEYKTTVKYGKKAKDALVSTGNSKLFYSLILTHDSIRAFLDKETKFIKDIDDDAISDPVLTWFEFALIRIEHMCGAVKAITV